MLEEKETFLNGDYAESITNPKTSSPIDPSASGHVDADPSIGVKIKSTPLIGSDNLTLVDRKEREEDSVADESTLTAKISATSGKTAGFKEDHDTLNVTDSAHESNGMKTAATATRSRLSNKKRRKQLNFLPRLLTCLLGKDS